MRPSPCRSLSRSAVLVLTASAALVAPATPALATQPPAAKAPGASSAASAPADETAAPGPIDVDLDRLKVPVANQRESRTTLSGDPVSAVLSPTRTEDFGMVGVTWDSGFSAEGVVAQIRTRTDGRWDAWQDLEIEEPAEKSEPGVRNGTAPLWVGEADGVAARVSAPGGERPTGLKVVTIDPGDAPAASANPAGGTAGDTAGDTAGEAVAPATRATYRRTGPQGITAAAADGSPRFIGRPSMVSRKGWGANPKYTSKCDSPRVASSLRGVIVHHTAGSNGYSRKKAPSVVRGIYAYHTKGRGWCDIGYNFLVDKYGTVYKGRRGSSYLAVRGAHAGNTKVNTYAAGIAMMGNLDDRWPSRAMRNKMVRMVGWKLASSYRHAKGKYKVAGGTLPRIAGHRQIYKRGIRPATSTACPGGDGMRWVRRDGSGLRDRVQRYISDYSTHIKRRRAKVGTGKIGKVHSAERRVAGGHRAGFTKSTGYWKKGYGVSFLSGPIRSRYVRLNEMSGPMGWVKTNIYASGRYPGVTKAQFQHGRIFARKGRAYAIHGRIWTRYDRIGGLQSRLAYPTSSVYKIPKGYKATFRGGYINVKNGRVRVHYT